MEEVQGLLADLRARTAGLEHRLHTFHPSHTAHARPEAVSNPGLPASDQLLRLSDGRLVLPSKVQLEG